MTTAIVILNWNGRDFLKKYLPCLLSSVEGHSNIQVIVADNASTDDSMEVMRECFPQVRTIVLDKNYGFADGYNKALKEVDTDLYLLLNSDVEVEDGWIEPLVEWMEIHGDCAICAPKLHQIDKRDTFEYAGAAGGYLDRFCYPFCRGRVLQIAQKDEGQYDVPWEVLWATGAALMVRSSVFNALGGFCAEFFAHMEEIDLCWRARLEGWKVNIVPRSVVYHVGGGSLPPSSPFKLFLNYRNNLLMMSRCLPKTFALESAYAIIGRTIQPDEGPDMIHNCNVVYQEEYDNALQQDMLTGCAQMGIARAKALITTRMLLDGMSACVYLLKGQLDNFKAVIRAHKEYRKMRVEPETEDIAAYLTPVLNSEREDIARTILTDEEDIENMGGSVFSLKGMWGKWIVLQAILKKESIFADIKNNIR